MPLVSLRESCASARMPLVRVHADCVHACDLVRIHLYILVFVCVCVCVRACVCVPVRVCVTFLPTSTCTTCLTNAITMETATFTKPRKPKAMMPLKYPMFPPKREPAMQRPKTPQWWSKADTHR